MVVRSYLCLTDQRGRGEPALELATAVLGQSRAGKEKQVRMSQLLAPLIRLKRRYIVCQVEVLASRVVESSTGEESERKYSCETGAETALFGKGRKSGGGRDSRPGCCSCWRRDADC